MGGPGFDARVTRYVKEVLANDCVGEAKAQLAVLIADDAARSATGKPRAVLVEAYRQILILAEIEAEKEQSDASANPV